MPTPFKSIRWRLPLSYIGVAALAALAAGLVMLVTLRGYYRQRELDYLRTNARQISALAQQLWQPGAPEAARVLADQIANWAFLLQVRVQVLGADGQGLADSGPPEAQQVVLVSGGVAGGLAAGAPVGPAQTFNTLTPVPQPGMFFISAEAGPPPGADVLVTQGCRAEAVPVAPDECLTQPLIIQYSQGGLAGGEVGFTQVLTDPAGPIGVMMPLTSSLFGFELDAPAANAPRSPERVEHPITLADGQRLGTVVLSDGPTYGYEILVSAMTAWAAASLVAVALAGAAGVWVSRRITVPLSALTAVTESMAAGDLAARANPRRADEFGALARSFNAMAEQVEATVHTLRAFVADAAHELNTPATALRLTLELAGAAPEHERPELLARAQAQLGRLTSLVGQLLELSRVEGQAGPAAPERVDLADLVRAASEPYASSAEQRGVHFDLELPAAPLWVRGRADQLRRALENLLDNAVKFTPSGGTVTARAAAGEGFVRVQVEDSGIGIPAPDLPLLFRRFHRGRNAAGYSGNGLGLAIVHAIAARHQGRLSAETLAPGARLTLELPLDEAAAMP